jgi:hypothetical protein
LASFGEAWRRRSWRLGSFGREPRGCRFASNARPHILPLGSFRDRAWPARRSIRLVGTRAGPQILPLGSLGRVCRSRERRSGSFRARRYRPVAAEGQNVRAALVRASCHWVRSGDGRFALEPASFGEAPNGGWVRFGSRPDRRVAGFVRGPKAFFWRRQRAAGVRWLRSGRAVGVLEFETGGLPRSGAVRGLSARAP